MRKMLKTVLFIGVWVEILGIAVVAQAGLCSQVHMSAVSRLFKAEKAGLYPRFDSLRALDFPLALRDLDGEMVATISQIKQTKIATFENAIRPIDSLYEKIDRLDSLFHFYALALPSGEVKQVEGEVSRLVSGLRSRVASDVEVYKKLESIDRKNLDHEQVRLIDHILRRFKKGGVSLSEADRSRLAAIESEIAELKVKFRSNTIKYNAENFLQLTERAQFEGLSDQMIKRFEEAAAAKSLSGFVVPLDLPVTNEVLRFAQSRDLRKQVWEKISRRSFESGQTDNVEVAQTISRLRQEQASLLGFSHFAELTLSDRMAKSVPAVREMIDTLIAKYIPLARREAQELQDLVDTKTSSPAERVIEPWDRHYWSEVLRKERYGFNEEVMRQHLPLERVRSSMFKTVETLFEIRVRERRDLPTPDADMQVYEIQTAKGESIGLMVMDLYQRPEKKPGAWMSPLVAAVATNGKRATPVVSVHMNILKPAEGEPVLLKTDEGRTLFHEVGHALHGLLTKARYFENGGTNVAWDFVELPSQFLENFFAHPRYLSALAQHHKTGAALPPEMLSALERLKKFQAGLSTLRQVELQLIDLAWHTGEFGKTNRTILEVERELLDQLQVLPSKHHSVITTGFSHIFSGDYGAGYYSYKWSEMLAAQAFGVFLKEGLDNPAVARRYRQKILEVGGSRDPLETFIDFAGEKPNLEALLESHGANEKIE